MEYNPNNVVIDGEIQGHRATEEGVRKLVWDLETTETRGVSEWGWNDQPDYTVVFSDDTGSYLGPEENGMIGYAQATPVTDEEALKLLEEHGSTSIDELADKEKDWQYKVDTAIINPSKRRFTDFSDLVEKAGKVAESRDIQAVAKIYADQEIF